MIQTLKNKISQDKKGCKIRFMSELSNNSLAELYCGYIDNLGRLYLCPTCQVRLKADEDNLILAEKFVSDLKEINILNFTPILKRELMIEIDTLANEDNSQQPQERAIDSGKSCEVEKKTLINKGGDKKMKYSHTLKGRVSN